MTTIDTKPIEVKPNGTKPTETAVTEPKENPLFFEVPVPLPNALNWMRNGLDGEWYIDAIPVSLRISGGMVMIGVLPKGAG